ncbi:class I SAM-dependent methyltransferase [Flavobacterium sp.]|uniref:class I SAM-dependent methyltransferase n=1 Tax=Flavobacterium sp. TaxID=239 RepID=UPI003D6B32B4
MKIPENYIEINRAAWNEKTAVHVHSDFYNLDGFLAGKTSLNEIELNLLGDISGLKVLHLQCHFGQDSISMAKLGASVTGVDLSDKAIETATEIAKKMNVSAHFICCDVYNLPQYLHEEFDMVFTSYGTIGWLPDLDKWAKVVSHFLKPKGKFVFAEFHPVVWMFDDYFKNIGYSYFNVETIIENIEGTYADKEAPIKNQTISWNHPLTEVFSSLLGNGLEIKSFNEYDYSPYACFNETEEFEPGKFRIKHLENKIPMVYALVATKK